jgi:hypothetical protein
MDYQIHPDSHYGIELRAGESTDDYISRARGFSSTAEFREYRSASQEQRKAMRRSRDNHSADSDEDSDRRRTLELLRICSE